MSDARTRPSVADKMLNLDPTRPIEADKSFGEPMSRLTSDFGDLVSTQVELAKVEIKEELRRAGRGAGMVSGAASVAYLAAIVLSLALAWLLARPHVDGQAAGPPGRREFLRRLNRSSRRHPGAGSMHVGEEPKSACSNLGVQARRPCTVRP